MANLVFNFVFLVIALSLSGCHSSPDTIFILGGQSNMAGRGGVPCNTSDLLHCKWDGYVPPKYSSQPSILRLNAESTWELARDPLHWDIDRSKVNGVGPGMAFANTLLAEANKNQLGIVGLVPCAIGGTHIREWVKGTHKYTLLLNRMKASEKYGGKVMGFLWFQGESDASVKEDADSYEENLTRLVSDIRADFQRPNLPFVLVKISNNDPNVQPRIDLTNVVREAEVAVKNQLPNIGIVDAKKAIKRVNKQLKPSFNKDAHLSVYTEVEIGKMLATAYFHQFRHLLSNV